MKFVSWNVNGLRACEGKGFSDIFRQSRFGTMPTRKGIPALPSIRATSL